MMKWQLPHRMLVSTMAILLWSTAWTADQLGAQETPQRLSAEFIPENALASIHVSLAEIVAAPEMKLMPIEVASAWTVENIGVDIVDVERIKGVVGVPGPQGVQFGVVVSMKADYDIARLNPQLLAGPAETIDGYQAVRLAGPPDVVISQIDPRTILVCSTGYLAEMMGAREANGTLARFVASLPQVSPVMLALVMEPVRGQFEQATAEAAGALPPPLRELAELPGLLDGVVVAGGITPRDKFRFVMMATDEEAASAVESIVNNALAFGRDIALVQGMRDIEGNGPVPEATRKYLQRLADEIVAMLTPERAGKRVKIEIENQGGVATAGMMVGLLLPAVQSARQAARRMSSTNNIKQLLLAMHNFHEVNRHLPEAISRDEDGEPLLSWRVAVLPYIEEQALYNEFHLDEPWDSEHNIQLLERMPQVYAHPGVDLPAGMTVYQVPVGDQYAFIAKGSTRFADVTDGTSNTIAVLETDAESAVPWTKPEDLKIDPENPLAHLGTAAQGSFNVGFMDGSVRFIADAIDGEMFKALLTRNGGEVVDQF